MVFHCYLIWIVASRESAAILIFNVFGRNRDTDVENELVGTGGEEEGETKWERVALPCVK